MNLIQITERSHPVQLAIAYATSDNFSGAQIYEHPHCFLHKDALPLFEKAISLAAALNLRLKVFDAFRPQEAQERLWQHTPDPEFLAPPERGSPHSRGVAIDLTLIDRDNNELPMGTAFDAFTPASHHGHPSVRGAALKNRLILLGVMKSAGWKMNPAEWWHYQLGQARAYPLLFADSTTPAMTLVPAGG